MKILLEFCCENLLGGKVTPAKLRKEHKEKFKKLTQDAIFNYFQQHDIDELYFYFGNIQDDVIYAIEHDYMYLMIVPAIINARYLKDEEKIKFIENLYRRVFQKVKSNFFTNIGFPFHKSINYLAKTSGLNWELFAGLFIEDKYSDPEDFKELSSILFNDKRIEWQYKVLYFLFSPHLTSEISTRKRYLILQDIIQNFFTSKNIGLEEKSQTALLFINNELDILGIFASIIKEGNANGIEFDSLTPGTLFIFELISLLLEDQREFKKNSLNLFLLEQCLLGLHLYPHLLEAVMRSIAKNFILIQDRKDIRQFIEVLIQHDKKYIKLGVLDAMIESKGLLSEKFIINILEKMTHSNDTSIRAIAYEYLFILSNDVEKYVQQSLRDTARKVRETVRRVALSRQKFSDLSYTKRRKLLLQVEKSGISLSPKQKSAFLKFKEELNLN